MYTKQQVIDRIEEENWGKFEMFMMDRETEYDEIELELYYPHDVVEFLELLDHKKKK